LHLLIQSSCSGFRLARAQLGAATLAGVVSLLALFAALCVVFVAGVSLMEWREEVAMEQWVPVMAAVEKGELEETDPWHKHDQTYFRLRYRVNFEARGQRVATTITSHSTPNREMIGTMQAWSEEHRPGGEVAIRYDPGLPTNAVFDPQTPGAGSRMGTNLTLLAIAIVACCALFPLARFLSSRERALRLAR
jgi:hypothetical protein